MVATDPRNLVRRRSRVVAKSFFRQLRDEGFTHEQIIDLSATLLDLVNDDIRKPTHGGIGSPATR